MQVLPTLIITPTFTLILAIAITSCGISEDSSHLKVTPTHNNESNSGEEPLADIPMPSDDVLIPNPNGISLSAEQKKFIRLTNYERYRRGLTPLIVSKDLVDGANTYAMKMAASSVFEHDSDLNCGENIARDFSSPDHTVDGLMNSESHKKNILDPDYKYIGVSSGYYTIDQNLKEGPKYWCQRFHYDENNTTSEYTPPPAESPIY